MNVTARFALISFVLTLVAIATLVALSQFLTVGSLGFDSQAITFYSVAFAVGIILWALIQMVARGAIANARSAGLAEGRESASASESPKPAPIPKPEPAKPSPPVDTNAFIETGAAQMLAILQRKGRLIDFLQEDISPYEDAQVGAAVRSIHQGCKDALAEAVNLQPIFDDAEGSNVTVKAGFDAASIRLSGNVSGDPPFAGALRHRGWQVESFSLPQKTGGGGETVIAAAEVEVA